MKIKALIFTIFVAVFSSTSFAQSFGAQAYVTVNATSVTAQVYNPYYRPIFCSGRTIGLTASGHTLFAYFNSAIPAGGYRYSYVYTNGYTNPFVNGWSEINCRF